jgi:hypothetical protein
MARSHITDDGYPLVSAMVIEATEAQTDTETRVAMIWEKWNAAAPRKLWLESDRDRAV